VFTDLQSYQSKRPFRGNIGNWGEVASVSKILREDRDSKASEYEVLQSEVSSG
jgi:hypothetical protein